MRDGSLSDEPLGDLCRRLSSDGFTGTVFLEGPAGSGEIRFRDGRIRGASSPAPLARLGDRLVHAGLLDRSELDNALEAQADTEEQIKLGAVLVERGLVSRDAIRVFVQEQILDALFDLVRWRDGDWSTRKKRANDERVPAEIPVARALEEVTRRRREWKQVERTVPHLDVVPESVGDEGTGGPAASLEPDELAVLTRVDGQQSIRQLALELGFGNFEVARIVYGLELLGAVTVPDSEPTEPSSDSPALLEKTWANVESDEPEPDVWVATIDESEVATVAPVSDPPEPVAPEPAPARPRDYSMFRELSALGDDEEPSQTPADPQPETETEPAAEDEPGEQQEETPPEPPKPPKPPPKQDRRAVGEISEFLRELSRLSDEEKE